MRWPRRAMTQVNRLVTGWNPLLIIAVLTAALVGSAVGAALGYVILRQRAEMIADQFALRIETLVTLALHEEHRVLEQLEQSPFAGCTDADLNWMRMVVFHSDYLSEVGRMKGERLICTAARGRLAAPGEKLTAEMIQPNGVRVFLNLAPYQKPGVDYIGMQKGDRFAIFRPTIETFFSSAPLRYAVTISDGQAGGPSRTMGSLRDVPAWILTRPGRLFWKNAAYATRCEAKTNTCITTALPLGEAYKYASSGILLTALVGAVVGGLIPLLSFVLSQRGYLMAWQLRQAIRANKLRVVYMPVVELISRKVVGAEALVRWDDEQGHAVSPEVFVRLAEERGFVGEITRLVVARVVGEMGEHLRRHPEFRLSVNATATDFADIKFVPMLRESLQAAGIESHSLIIEITESSTARKQAVRETIRELRDQGFGVHIDDFGTGYSSLAYLHELKVDAIKIDRSFTGAIGSGTAMETILAQIVAMVDSLDLEVVVEGIETEQQAGYFTALSKPRLAQGWLFGAPVPMDTFFDLYGPPAVEPTTRGEA